jgi:hypothetical protein
MGCAVLLSNCNLIRLRLCCASVWIVLALTQHNRKAVTLAAFTFNYTETNQGSQTIQADTLEDAQAQAYKLFTDGQITWARSKILVEQAD